MCSSDNNVEYVLRRLSVATIIMVGCIIHYISRKGLLIMSDFETLIKEYLSIEACDRGGFFLAKVQTVDGYSKAFPMIWELVETFMCKTAVLDGILDISEYAVIQGLAIHRHGAPFDPKEFKKRIGDFAREGADTKIAEVAFAMLPEYVRDDIVMMLICFASVDADVSPKESEWISTLCF